MNTSLNRGEVSSLTTLSLVCLGILANSFHGDGEPLIVSGALSGIAFASTYSLIRWLGNSFIKVGLKGRDMSKLKKVDMYIWSNQFQHSVKANIRVNIVPKQWALSVRLCIYSH